MGAAAAAAAVRIYGAAGSVLMGDAAGSVLMDGAAWPRVAKFIFPNEH
jgi:hypothetical protein